MSSIDVRVATGNDDAEEDTTGAVARSSTDLELVFDNDDQVVGIRFVGVAIPPGSSVLNAYVQFQVDAASSDATSLVIEGQATDNPATFAATSFNISSRPRTTLAASWSPAAWPTAGAAGPDQRTPDLSSVIQEIVDRPGWASGNALVLIITGTGKRVAESFNGLAAAAPLLHVEYEPFVPNTPPDVTISDPVNNGRFEQGTPVSFAGSATDTEDGNVSASLAWTSDRNGQIGTGPSFTRSDLSPGAHTIAALAADSASATGSATVQIAITIGGNTPPSVTIAAPAPGSSYFRGQFVSFAGTANDVEDGNIGSAIAWSSNLDGPIGAGASFTTPDLSAGTHTITASVIDAGGLTSQAQVSLTVDVSAPAILVGAGNIADCTDVEDEATATLLDGTPGIVFTLGDNAYEDASAADFANCYAPTWGRHKARTLPTIGQQEYLDPGAAAYFDYFGTAAGDRTKGYSSYDAGEWHVVVLNSECSQVGGCGRSSPQGQWLQADLAAHPSTCVLAMWNQPLFSSTSGASSNTRDFWQILYEAGADVVLNAHRTSYERFAPQDPDGAAKPTQGIQEFVVGTGGTGVTPYTTVAPNSEVQNGSTFGVLKLTLRPTSYDWQFLPIAGQSFSDSGSASCVGAAGNHPPAVTITAPFNGSGFAPATPIVFSATAIDPEFGDVSASLTWTSSVDGAIGSGPTFAASTLSPGTHAITATATDGLLSSSDVTTITVFNPGTVEVRVAASSDDAEEDTTGSVSLNSSDLELVFHNDDQQVGVRFLGVAIPAGATITTAYVQFQVDQSESIPTPLVIEGQTADNPVTFASTAYDLSSRPRTSAAVSWSPPPWPTVGEAGPDQRTSDLSPIVQELVNRPGWASGNAIVLLVRGSGKRVAESYNGLPAAAPLLHVEYATGSGGPEEPPALSPAAGTYEDPIEVSISGGPSCESIRYTTDGSAPSTGSNLYIGPLSITTPTTVKAACFKEGWPPGPVAEASYNFRAPSPVITPPGGAFTEPVTARVTTAEGTVMRCTTDGVDPTEASNLCSGLQMISTTTDLRARAFKAGWAPSLVTRAIFSIQSVTASLKVMPHAVSIAPSASSSLAVQATYSDGSKADVTGLASWTTSDAAVATVTAGTVTAQATGLATMTASYQGLSATARVEVNDGSLPPDPAAVAPAVDPTVATTLGAASEFLYTGANPLQSGVAPGTIDPKRVAVLRGIVRTREGAALTGVQVTVLGHPAFGSTVSRLDGGFDMVVNGGGPLTVQYQKSAYVTVQRQVTTAWQEYAWLPDVVMLPYDTAVTAVSLGAPSMQTARGSAVADTEGSRRATLLFAGGTAASMVLPDGSTQPLLSMSVRATEYTVGPNGPSAMPAPLPPASGYTYAAEFSVDEAAGATAVLFSQPVISYTENFLGFPVGSPVPAGYYNRQKAAWIPSDNGRVIKVLSVAGGLADLDLDGSGTPAGPVALAALGITEAERQRLAVLYGPGQSLWRVPISHFSPIDYNWPYGPPNDAIAPDGEPEVDKPEKDPCEEEGSIIECQTQVLGQEVNLTGTPFRLHYNSLRVPGRKASYTVRIPLSGASLPASVKRMELEVEVAGQRFTQAFAPELNRTESFTWDGLDGYGRQLQGSQPARVGVGYVYDAVYKTPAEFANSFGAYGGAAIATSRARQEVTISKETTVGLGAWDARANGLGGWTLDVQHSYDPNSRTVYLGSGARRRDPSEAGIITTVAFTPEPWDLAAGPDGSIYIANFVLSVVQRLDPDGAVTTVAGDGTFGFGGDGGPATAAQLNGPTGVALGADGRLYIADWGNNRVRRVGPDGIMTTVAGDGTWGTAGDGGPATAAQLGDLAAVRVGPDGSLYISQSSIFHALVRRVSTDGIITTVAGTGISGFGGDGGPATEAQLRRPEGLFAASDGSLFIADSGNHRIRRVGPEGTISTVAGSGIAGPAGDGGAATVAQLNSPSGIALASDGSLLIGDTGNDRIRRVAAADGTISTVAGTGQAGFSGDGGLATAARLIDPLKVTAAPDGALYIADTANDRVRRVGPGLPGVGFGNGLVPSDDGTRAYAFDERGRHLRTVNTLTGATVHTLGYDSTGRLTSVTDGDGNVTQIDRGASGQPAAVVAPGGQRTPLHLDGNGYLDEITDPAGKSFRTTQRADGLLTSFTDRNGNLHAITYDDSGRLSRDENVAGGFWNVTRAASPGGWTVNLTSALGHTKGYRVESLSTGGRRLINFGANGLTTTTAFESNGRQTITSPDGTITTLVENADPRWGMQSPLYSSATATTPGGLTAALSSSRSVQLADASNPLSLQSLTGIFTINGKSYTTTFTAATRTRETVSPMGRHTIEILDSQGRIVEQRLPGVVLPITYQYDTGRLTAVRFGDRSLGIEYDTKQRPLRVQDSALRSFRFEQYEGADRVTKGVLPDTSEILFGYDASGNVTSVTPPGRPAHGFTYSGVDLLLSYTRPDLGSGPTAATTYTHNLDRQPLLTSRPDGKTIERSYDEAGRLGSVTTDHGVTTYTYHPTSGNLSAITAPDGSRVSYGDDGSLLTSTTWTGPVAGSVSRVYDNNLRLSSESVNGGSTVTHDYDDDGLLMRAGDLVISRYPNTSPWSGLISGTTLGNVSDSYEYNDYGDLAHYTARSGTTEIYDVRYHRDTIGRIDQVTETIDGVTRVFGYEYYPRSELKTVSRNGAVIASYGYDSNGNRLTAEGERGSFSGTANDRDQMMSYGGASFSYSPAGEMLTRTDASGTTSFDFDARGTLRGVVLPDGTNVEYVLDAAGHRVGKRVNGTLVERRLYGRQLEVLADLDATGAVSARYVFLDPLGSAAYMTKDGHTYRIISDHLGGARVVIDATSGQIAQRLDFDEWGELRQDSAPGFQPFAFTGREWDPEAQLYYYRARYYDPKVGRFLSEDPIGFKGGINFYVYVGSNPVNRTDPSGLCPCEGGDPLDDYLNCMSRCTSKRLGMDPETFTKLLGLLGGIQAVFNQSIPGSTLTQGEMWGAQAAGIFSSLLPGVFNTAPGQSYLAYALGDLGGAIGGAAGIAAAAASGYALGTLGYCSVSCHLDPCSY